MRKELIIIGASGFGREVAWLVERINQVSQEWNLLGFVDDDASKQGMMINNYPVLGTIDTVVNYPDCYLVCAIGSSKTRNSIIDRINKNNSDVKYATLIDPTVLLSNSVCVGSGTIICANSIATVNIDVGNHVIINLDCTIGHDAVIEDYVTIYPSVNVSGATTVGKCTELGTGTQIIQGISIGDNTIIGAGSVVVRNIPSSCTAVGVPAKPIKFFNEV